MTNIKKICILFGSILLLALTLDSLREQLGGDIVGLSAVFIAIVGAAILHIWVFEAHKRTNVFFDDCEKEFLIKAGIEVPSNGGWGVYDTELAEIRRQIESWVDAHPEDIEIATETIHTMSSAVATSLII